MTRERQHSAPTVSIKCLFKPCGSLQVLDVYCINKLRKSPTALVLTLPRLWALVASLTASLTMVACVSPPQQHSLPRQESSPNTVEAAKSNDASSGDTLSNTTVVKTPQTLTNSKHSVQTIGDSQSASVNRNTLQRNPQAPLSSGPTTSNEIMSSSKALNTENSISNKPKDSRTAFNSSLTAPTVNKAQAFRNLPSPVFVDKISLTGKLENSRLAEVSGLTASNNSPGVLYAINDSGDSATLYALSEQGQHIGQWSVQARNRDWEDLDNIVLNKQSYILLGDTGDNRRVRKKSTFYVVAEPLPTQPVNETLVPVITIDFTYEDGPRNVEAFSVHESTIYLISKEPLSGNGPTASRLYALQIPSRQPSSTLTARFLAELPLPRISLESKLAASLVGVDLDHVTAMDITNSGRAAYLLTYREVQKIERRGGESWAAAFQRRGRRIHSHNLGQAEALTIAPGRSVFITAERRGAPLWAIPIQTAP